MTADFERLGAFYLGRLFDVRRGSATSDLLLYDAKDLTTHAICVGMTGSGKTGLCLSLLEEAAIDGVPAIAIDPKGDLGNLLLAFPELRSTDFRPWIEQSEAARHGMTPDEYAQQTARRWREGLAQWGQDGARIERYRSSVDLAIYTPGSTAGLPLTVLRSFDPPAESIRGDVDAYAERISASVSGLLALLGIPADPIRSREHILLSKLLDRAWREGRSLDIANLIRGIQQPPFDKIGVMDLETVFPANDRLGLSMALNNLIGSPSFAKWTQGESLDVKRLLYTEQGTPRLSIISIAHLSESERMFFVTILLNEVLAWMRAQPGTSSLRALLYMDEVFGYFPPIANPPSKATMLTLLKQARAYGLGVVLATQNPVDLDYKGLSNAGTWFLGRLQTERDQARVLDGLEGAAAAAGTNFDRQWIESTLAGLSSRVFLMNNVHEDEPVVFHTRWALSYLRGPLTRDQIRVLMAQRREASSAGAPAALPVEQPGVPADAELQRGTAPAGAPLPDEHGSSAERPIVPAEAGECFLVPRRPVDAGCRLIYRPALLGQAQLHFVRASFKVDQWKTVFLLSQLDERELDDVWQQAHALEREPDLEQHPGSRFQFASLPAAAGNAGRYKSWSKDLRDFLYRERKLTVWKCAALKQYSRPDEAEDEFRIRLTQLAKERRDLEIEKLRKRYSSKLAKLKDRVRRADERVERETSQYRSQQLQSAISIGTTVLGALFGRKLASRTNVSKAGTSLRSAGRAAQQHADIGRAKENLAAIQEKLAALEVQFEDEVKKVERTVRADQMKLEQLEVRPRKSDIRIERCVLTWTPWQVDASGIAERID